MLEPHSTTMKPALIGLSLTILPLFGGLQAADSDAAARPKPIPQTRPAMKEALDELKRREPRIPMPPDADGARGRSRVNNGRMRNYYLPPEFSQGGFPRGRDPNATLDYAFTVEFFWIASRVNNCHYCLGHQESKLRAAGRTEERLAALDCDWSAFTPAETAAFAFARKLSLEPQLISRKDIDELGEHYRPLQIIEICLHVAGYNAMNRWTDGIGIPQEDHREFRTETPDAFRALPSRVAPAAVPDRGPLPTRGEVETALQTYRTRNPLLPLVGSDEARQLLDYPADRPVPHWIRLLANFPVSSRARIAGYQAVQDKGRVPSILKAKMNWIAARHDRAWYALGLAWKKLHESGLSADDIFALETPAPNRDPGEQAALDLAAKLTAAPQSIVDNDIARLRGHFSDQEVAEIVHAITQAAFLHRATEPAQLPLEH